jgi:hypothetical protein
MNRTCSTDRRDEKYIQNFGVRQHSEVVDTAVEAKK